MHIEELGLFNIYLDVMTLARDVRIYIGREDVRKFFLDIAAVLLASCTGILFGRILLGL